MNGTLFIALEGLNGTGKTTTAGRLGAVRGIRRMPAIPAEYATMRGRFTRLAEIDARFLYFLSAVSLAATRIGPVLVAGEHVVVDSYYARAVAFHRAMGSAVNADLPALRMPDVTFQLACSPAVRLGRLSRRGGSRELWDELAEACAPQILHEYRAFGCHVIDTTMLSPQQVTDEVLRHRLDGMCDCEDTQPLAGHQDILSALPGGAGGVGRDDGMRSGSIGREVRHTART